MIHNLSPNSNLARRYGHDWRALCFLILLLALGGCKKQPATPLPSTTVSPTPTAKPTPRKKPTPTPRPPAGIVYGVNTQSKVMALTFDDGPAPTWTPQVLAILKAKRVPATFFMVGKMVNAYPKWARQVKAAKHPIGNHSWSHPRWPRSAQAEVERTDAILQKTVHVKSTMFRPPFGILDNGLAKAALSRGLDVIIWTAVAADWHKSSAPILVAKVLKRATPGGIVLLHDGGGNRRSTVAALPRIIEGLRRRGYRFVTVPQLLTLGPLIHTAPKAGTRKLNQAKLANQRKLKPAM